MSRVSVAFRFHWPVCSGDPGLGKLILAEAAIVGGEGTTDRCPHVISAIVYPEGQVRYYILGTVP